MKLKRILVQKFIIRKKSREIRSSANILESKYTDLDSMLIMLAL